MIIKFTVDVAIGSGLGVVVGAFLPSIGRKIKALWVKETQVAKKDLVAVATGVNTAVKAGAEKVVSKL